MQNVNKILIIRFSSLGDVVLATPLIRILRQNFPGAKLDFLVRQEYAELLENNPKIDQLLKFEIRLGFRGLRQLKKDLKNNNYSVILDIHNNLRSRYLCMGLAGPFSKTYVLRIQKQQFARFLLVKFKINLYRRLYGRIIAVWEKYVRTARPLFGGTAMEERARGDASQEGKSEIFLSKESEKKAKKIHAEQLENKNYLTLAPGAKHFTKRWPADYYCELVERIYQETKIKSVLIGGNDDVAVSEMIFQRCGGDAVISLAGLLSIQETAAVIKNSGLLISNDSGLMHVADALGVPLIAIFGSTVEELGFFPVSKQATVIQNLGLYCRPCSHIGRSYCPKDHFRCMQEIIPDIVWQTFQEKISVTPKKGGQI